MNTTILMIDDDTALLRLTELTLGKAGFRVVTAPDGIRGLQLLERAHPALVLLDVSMPKLDGWETCRLIRELSDVPLIMLTARDSEADTARGLDLGADDYLSKPFGFVELQARIRAALRRAAQPAVTLGARRKSVYRLGSLLVDLAAHSASRDGEPVALTPIEFRLLALLLEHAGQVLTHGQLLGNVWGAEYSDATDLLKPAISRLRQKVEDEPGQPRLIRTVHGVGYRLILPAEPGAGD